LPHGQHSIAWFCVTALLGVLVLIRVARWYHEHETERAKRPRSESAPSIAFSRRKIAWSIAVLVALIFSKYFYLASLTSYYTFYLISRFHVTVASAQLLLFLFLGSSALGVLLGGPIGDRLGRKIVIWGSIVGVLPFTLVLPLANLFWTAVLTVLIGLVLSSAFSAIVVYAQELLPGKVGMISGLLFGLAFGMGGIGAASLGELADHTSIEFVYKVCAYLPAIGLLATWLPDVDREAPLRRKQAPLQ